MQSNNQKRWFQDTTEKDKNPRSRNQDNEMKKQQVINQRTYGLKTY